jgi:hypothetical protein
MRVRKIANPGSVNTPNRRVIKALLWGEYKSPAAMENPVSSPSRQERYNRPQPKKIAKGTRTPRSVTIVREVQNALRKIATRYRDLASSLASFSKKCSFNCFLRHPYLSD